LRFASARHAHQYREIDHAPFIAHPIEVGSLLRRDGQPDEIIAAELLRDVLEKDRDHQRQLHHRFGAQIARVVESVSDDPSLGDYKPRKRELRDRVAHAGPGTCAVFAVDKIAKVRELSLLSAWQLNEPKIAPSSPISAPASRCSSELTEATPCRSPRRRAQATPHTGRQRNSPRRNDHERRRQLNRQRPTPWSQSRPPKACRVPRRSDLACR
jgi:hypothetical protein